jgi:hypothetical protein
MGKGGLGFGGSGLKEAIDVKRSEADVTIHSSNGIHNTA